MADTTALAAAIESGNRTAATTLTRQALDEGVTPGAVLDVMTGALKVVGQRFQANEIYVPEMLMAARAMKESMVILEPLLTASGIRPEHTAVIGTITGDLHDIGKNLVAMMWRGANFAVVDIGTNVPPERFVESAREHRAAIIGVSALLTTTMVGMASVVQLVRSELPGVKVVVGGAPVTQEYADSIGADGFAPDAASAVDVVRRVLGSA
jgi:5-methyltetrahydrofolate--homocysteine methyltransferase